ncbi:MAG: hypothetical protein ACI3ZQ_02900 [Candidatus Cryptobacteroides sp.]
MKKLSIILSVACASLLLFSTSASAQKYKASKADENWFATIAGGGTFYGDGGAKVGYGADFQVDFGKWFLPQVGFRLGYEGLNASCWTKDANKFAPNIDTEKELYKNQFNFAYIHADLLWDFTNTILEYKPNRIWNLIPYGHIGYFYSFGGSSYRNETAKNHTIAGGFGLLNKIYISDITRFIIDLRGHLMPGQAHGTDGVSGMISLSAGLSFNLGKVGFDGKGTKAAATAAGAAAAAKALENADKAKETVKDAPKAAVEENDGLTPAERAAKTAAEILLKQKGNN